MPRRAPALLLATAVAATLLSTAPAGAASGPRSVERACPSGQVQEDGFGDVPYANVHEAAVDCVVHWGVASGRSATAYAPSAAVDRAQMATFLVRLVERSGGTLPAASRDHFTDDGASAHQGAINRLAEAGVVSGTGGGTFSPTAPVTRAQMAAFLVRAADHRVTQAGQAALPAGEDAFPDDDTSPLRAEIDTAAAAGFAGGFSDGTYRPGGRVPRDQMGTFLARVLDLVVERGLAGVPAGPRALTSTGFRPYATAGPVVLHAPADVVEVIGFHEANHDGARAQAPAAGGPRSLLLPSRGRGTDPRSAADVVADPSREVRSPVTGTVRRAGAYVLYCKYTDHYAVIEPDARPGWEVKVLHVQGLQLQVGQRVEGGVTVIAAGPRLFPFGSQVDEHTAAPHWPHVHVEVVDPSIPDRPGSGGGC